MQLSDYKVRVLDNGAGTGARVRVLIESTDGKRRWGTVGVSNNVIEASWQALVDSVEYKLHRDRAKPRIPARERKAGGLEERRAQRAGASRGLTGAEKDVLRADADVGVPHPG